MTIPFEEWKQVRQASWARRLAALLVRIRSKALEGPEVNIARAVDEAFASFARESR
ncbi:MAG TPA: hypothetical protein VMH40_14120 [Myxococcaceae bacterium]|nr:hypothetical protein [Myxococcaceae bacterium]